MPTLNRTYIELLEEKKVSKPLKVPRYLSQLILNNNQLMKAVCVYVELKPLFYDGRIYNYKKNKYNLARFLNMGQTSFNYKIERLIKHGLVSIDARGDLLLCSWNKFYLNFGHSTDNRRKFQFYKLKNEISNSEFFLRFYAVKENFERQKNAIDKKIYNKNFKDNLESSILKEIQLVHTSNNIAILDRQRIITGLIEKLSRVDSLKLTGDYDYQKFKKGAKFNLMYLDEMKTYFKERSTFNHNSRINFDISISCKKMAEIYNLSSSSSGWYWQQLLKNVFWKIEPRSIFIKDMNTFRFYHEQKSGNLSHHYFEGRKRGIFRRLTNQITLIEPTLF